MACTNIHTHPLHHLSYKVNLSQYRYAQSQSWILCWQEEIAKRMTPVWDIQPHYQKIWLSLIYHHTNTVCSAHSSENYTKSSGSKWNSLSKPVRRNYCWLSVLLLFLLNCWRRFPKSLLLLSSWHLPGQLHHSRTRAGQSNTQCLDTA